MKSIAAAADKPCIFQAVTRFFLEYSSRRDMVRARKARTLLPHRVRWRRNLALRKITPVAHAPKRQTARKMWYDAQALRSFATASPIEADRSLSSHGRPETVTLASKRARIAEPKRLVKLKSCRGCDPLSSRSIFNHPFRSTFLEHPQSPVSLHLPAPLITCSSLCSGSNSKIVPY